MSNSTSTFPTDTIVEITDEIGDEDFQASGVLISPDEVLTASHVVYQAGVGTATDIEVSPGYEDGATPFGTIAGTSFHYNDIDDSNDLISLASSQSDFAVIHLASPVNIGSMDLGSDFAGGAATVSGYPASAGGTQVDRAETVRVDPQYTLFDGTALGDGSSGGPVWILGPGGAPEVVGLVSSGSGRQGYFVQLTGADVSEIEGWVAEDDGTSPTATATSVVETVPGAGGSVVSLTFPATTAPLAATLLAQLSADIAAGALVAETATPGNALPAVPSGAVGELVVSQAQSVTVTPPYEAVVDNATGGSTVTLLAADNATVVASGGPLTLFAGGTGTLAGGGNGTLFYQPAATGSTGAAGGWDVALAGGANTIAALSGADTLSAGGGANLIFLGSGASSVASTGADTLVGGTGAATISAAGNQALAFGGAGTLVFLAGTAASTVVGGSGGTTVRGGSGATLFVGAGASSYQGGGAADTVLGGSGSLDGNGNGGAILMFGGSAGGNQLASGAGAATLVGGGSGDVLTATGTSDVVLIAGAGAETLSGAAASGADVVFGGTGPDLLQGGAGNDAIVAGEDNDTLTGGGGGNAFIFDSGVGTGSSDVVTDFAAGRDFVALEGFASGAAAAAAQSAITVAGGTQVTLTDGTHILFAGVTSIGAGSFI